jgi:hypothetical protein
MNSWKRLIAASLLAAAVLMTQGCAYMHVQTPLDTNFDATELGAKEGRSHAYSVLWLFAWGDAGTKAAATQGNLKVIRHADTEVKSVLFGLYSHVTTVVYGD